MTDGNVFHYGYIEKFIESLGEKYNIREFAYDRWGAVQMVQIPVHIEYWGALRYNNYIICSPKRGKNMKDIIEATDMFMVGFSLFTICSGLLSAETGGKILSWYLVARFILKRITK